MNASVKHTRKKIVASTAVVLLRKLAEPRAPNSVADDPPPKAAPRKRQKTAAGAPGCDVAAAAQILDGVDEAALLEVVEAGSKNIEVAVLRRGEELKMLGDEEVETIVQALEAEKKAAEAKKKPAPMEQ